MLRLYLAAAIGTGMTIGCATAPDSPQEAVEIKSDAQSTIETMTTRDPSLRQVLDQAAGYAVFPTVGKGGMLVGGAHGNGVLFENGQPVGYVQLNQASIGAQLGGQTFSEIVVFRTPEAVSRMKQGEFNLTADTSAIALRSGAAAAARFNQDIAVFVAPKAGAMIEVSVGGQRLEFEPIGV